MDIKVVSHLPPAAATLEAVRAPVTRVPQSEPRTQVDGAGKLRIETAMQAAARELTEAVTAIGAADIPRNVQLRAQLDIDEKSRRVFARIFDRETGELVRQYPVDEALRLVAKTREQFGRIFRADV